jgi:hypothetical protein
VLESTAGLRSELTLFDGGALDCCPPMVPLDPEVTALFFALGPVGGRCGGGGGGIPPP